MNAHRDRLQRRMIDAHPSGYAGSQLRPGRIARILLPLVLAPLALVLAGLLTGCKATVPIVAPPPEPVPAQCDPRCFESCDVRIPPWTPPDPDSPEAWDLVPGQVLIPARLRLERCEAHRWACAQCLDRLRDAGVIR